MMDEPRVLLTGATGYVGGRLRQAFRAAARAAGLRRIIYLGGLGQARSALSPHLRSRHETGEVLRAAGVPVIEFRAGIILGSGSLSYELIRALVERLPVMICPRWVRVKTQPIAIEDVIAYLTAALRLPDGPHRISEIGGAEQVSYADIMLEYARQRGLRRLLNPVPLLTPHLSSLWLGLTTAVYARVGRKLIESVRHPTVVTDPSAREAFPIRPMGLRQAIERARHHEDQEFAATRWSDAISVTGARTSWAGVQLGTRLIDARSIHVAAPPAAAFAPIWRIGGERGWYYAGDRISIGVSNDSQNEVTGAHRRSSQRAAALPGYPPGSSSSIDCGEASRCVSGKRMTRPKRAMRWTSTPPWPTDTGSWGKRPARLSWCRRRRTTPAHRRAGEGSSNIGCYAQLP